MRTGRNLPYRYGAGGHNNRPVYPDNIQTQHHLTGKGCVAGVILILAFLLATGVFASTHFFIPWWVEAQVERYTPFDNRISAGTITSVRTEESNISQLLLTTPVDGGTMPALPYLVRCKEWRLHADILTTPSWISTQAHSWYQLTLIEGKQCLDQHGKPQASLDIPIIGSNDGFGASVQKGKIWGAIVSAKEITSNFMPFDGKSYKVIVTSTALLLVANH